MLLMHSGRAVEAIAMLDDGLARPRAYPPGKLDCARLTALALGSAGSAAEALEKNFQRLLSGEIDPLTVARRCAALGEPDECFAILDGYFFGQGRWSMATPPAQEDLSTSELFMPPMAFLWSDPRFTALTEAIGLDEYWSLSGNVPDFRQVPM